MLVELVDLNSDPSGAENLLWRYRERGTLRVINSATRVESSEGRENTGGIRFIYFFEILALGFKYVAILGLHRPVRDVLVQGVWVCRHLCISGVA